MLITTTHCQPSWPRAYRTHYQEISPPYRRCDDVLVLRVGRHGIVIGRYTGQADNEHQALKDAIGARDLQALDHHRHLLPHFRRRKPRETS